jgi:uncharacterized protein (TIGR00725 family)
MDSPVSVSVIGDGKAEASSNLYTTAIEVGKTLVNNNFRIVHGGMYGVMEAVSIGARKSRKYRPDSVIGILPHFDPSLANPYCEITIPTGLDTYRNGIVANSIAVIALGGGAGTLSEMAFAWILNSLILAWRKEGWSARLADTRIDDRIRVNISEDRIFGFDAPDQIIELLHKYVPIYQKTRHGIVEGKI